MVDRSAPLSFRQQAELIEALISRCTMRDGATAKETWMLVEAEDVAKLEGIASRLRRMYPYETRIRDMVMKGAK